MPITAPIARPLKVGVVMHASQEHMRQVALGVVHYTQINPHWVVEGDGFHPLVPWNRLRYWRGDGIIAVVNSHEQVDSLASLKVPFVLAGSRILDPDYSVVASDNHLIGREAAAHLMECGFRRLVFLGQTVWDDEQQRLRGFREAVEEAGMAFSHSDVRIDEYFARDSSAHYRTNVRKLVSVLRQLEHPAGVFCPNSVIARGLVEACRRQGLSIPDTIGVIGVNNDALECESTQPAVSTVRQQSRNIGFRAAELLDKRVRLGAESQQIYLPPQGIVARRSTDVLLVKDPKVARAIQFMREHSGDRIGVQDVAAAAEVSRRSLEIKFRQELQRSPLAELNRIRIAKAKQLLRYSDLSITAIALAVGFGGSQSFCVAFKKSSGCSPTEFRRPAAQE